MNEKLRANPVHHTTPSTSTVVVARRLVNRSGEACVAPASAATARNHHALVGLRKVVHHFARQFVVNDGSNGDLEDDAFAFATGFVRAFAMASLLRFIFGIKTEVHQSIVALARFHHYVAAVTAIAARRTAARHELLPPEGHAAIAAIACFYSNFCFVNEHKKSNQQLAFGHGKSP